MDEAGWLASAEPFAMLEYLRPEGGPARPGATARRLRLFACACARRLWPRLTDPRSRRAVEVAERFADGLANAAEMEAARRACGNIGKPEWHAGSQVCMPDAVWAAKSSCFSHLRNVFPPPAESDPAGEADLLRDLFDPFRRPAVASAWRAWHGCVVLHLARAAYDERHLPGGTLDRARLAVLADALEEAGCEDPLILGHLRSERAHVRGCAVLDAVLRRK
jgi:hypothetical protein